MKTLAAFTTFFVVLGTAFAQERPQSLLNQIPYVPEKKLETTHGFLDVSQALQGLDPLPDFQIPQRLPNEFVLTALGWELMNLSQKANEFLVGGEPEKSVEIFEKTREKWPNELGIRVALADSYYAMGSHREAELQYKAVLEKIPMHFQCLNNLAWLYATSPDPSMKNLEAALELANLAKVVQPQSHHLWSTLSQIYFEQGQYVEAGTAINNALAIVRQTTSNLGVVVSYLIQRDRCAIAQQATSIFE